MDPHSYTPDQPKNDNEIPHDLQGRIGHGGALLLILAFFVAIALIIAVVYAHSGGKTAESAYYNIKVEGKGSLYYGPLYGAKVYANLDEGDTLIITNTGHTQFVVRFQEKNGSGEWQTVGTPAVLPGKTCSIATDQRAKYKLDFFGPPKKNE